MGWSQEQAGKEEEYCQASCVIIRDYLWLRAGPLWHLCSACPLTLAFQAAWRPPQGSAAVFSNGHHHCFSKKGYKCLWPAHWVRREKPASQTPGRKDLGHLPEWRPLGDSQALLPTVVDSNSQCVSTGPGKTSRCSAEAWPQEGWLQLQAVWRVAQPFHPHSPDSCCESQLLDPDTTEHKGTREPPKEQDLEQLIFVPIFQNLRLPAIKAVPCWVTTSSWVPAGEVLHHKGNWLKKLPKLFFWQHRWNCT